LPIVLVGPEEVRPEFAGLLSKEATDCLAGWTSAEAHADGRELLEAARPLLEEWWAGREGGGGGGGRERGGGGGGGEPRGPAPTRPGGVVGGGGRGGPGGERAP